MMRSSTPLAVAADYADALMTARRAKNLLFLLLLVMILLQLASFFLARFGVVRLGTAPVASSTVMAPPAAADPATQPAAVADAAATQPSTLVTQPVAPATGRDVEMLVRYVIPLTTFGAVALSIVMAVVMLLLVTIMLVGRLIGVSSVTGAFIWGVLLVVLLVPWQTFLIQSGDYAVAGSPAGVSEQPAFKWPGATYTYAELKRDYAKKFDPAAKAGEPAAIWPNAVWFWGRYVGMPALALLLLLTVQFKSGRGLRYALGEADINVEVTTNQKDIAIVS
ncbi:MAG: hypothetical protein JWO31_3370 [Phycisphaerales bacterium]|nr:hypothetical protein [Phycisphaerales bacterium]